MHRQKPFLLERIREFPICNNRNLSECPILIDGRYTLTNHDISRLGDHL